MAASLTIFGIALLAIGAILLWRILQRAHPVFSLPTELPAEEEMNSPLPASFVLSPAAEQRLRQRKENYAHAGHHWERQLHQLGTARPADTQEYFRRLQQLVLASQHQAARLTGKEKQAFRKLERLVKSWKSHPRPAASADKAIAALRNLAERRR